MRPSGRCAMIVVVVVVLVVHGERAEGDLILGEVGVPVSVTFDGYLGTGLVPDPAPGQLDSDTWRVTGLSDGDGVFGGVHDGGDFARGASGGGVTTGGLYAFEVAAGNVALGVQPGGSDFTPGAFTVRLRNESSAVIDELVVSFDVWVRNDQGRSSTLDFAWSLDDATYVPIPSLQVASAADPDDPAAWLPHGRAITLTGLGLLPGERLLLQWSGDDLGGSGGRDEFALDELQLLALPGPGGVPILGAAALLSALRRRSGPGRRER